MTAYNETCASVGKDYWNHRLFLLHGDAQYIDVMERTLYNGLISGVSLDGKTFFYQNPLESNGQHARQAWFGVACCPGNITRFMASVPGYIYAQRGRHAVRQSLRRRDGRHRSGGRHAQDRRRTRAIRGTARCTIVLTPRPASRVHGQRPRSRAGRASSRSRATSIVSSTGSAAADARGQRQAGRDDADQGLRADRAHVEGWRRHRARPADAGSPRRRQRSTSQPTRPGGAAAGPIVYAAEWPDNPTARSATSSCRTRTR